MSGQERKRPPIVRLPPRSNFELVLARGSQASLLVVGLVASVFALHAGKFLLAPVAMAVVVGLMLGPLASRMERAGVPPGASSAAVSVAFIVMVGLLAAGLAAPLALWTERLPAIWSELQGRLASFRAPLETVRELRDEIRSVTGGEAMTVSIEGDNPIASAATLAPTLVAQFLIFFASLYFFVATRHQTRAAILGMCFNRRLRWRVAHIFRDVEWMVSRYLLSITGINVALGIAVTAALWLVGVPSPYLWGVLAALLNFVIYIGPAIMAVIMFGVGLATFDTLGASLVPVAAYLAVNALEAQFVTPMVIGRTMTLNPFLVFLALAFWVWIWGPIGGFIAIPALLILHSIARNILPGIRWA